MIGCAPSSVPKGSDTHPSPHHPVIISLTSLSQLKPRDKLFLAARCFVVAIGLLLVAYHFFKSSATRHSPIEWFDMNAINAKLAADSRPSDANLSASVYQQGFAVASLPAESPPAASLPAESPPAVSLPTESPPAVSLPAESPPAVSLPAKSPPPVLPAKSPPPVSLPAESPPAVSLPAQSPPAKPPLDRDGPLVAFDRAFASLISFQRKGRVPFANVATFNFDPSVTSAAFVATRYKLLSLPVPRVPEKLTWRDAYPVWVNESRSSCPTISEPSYPDWLTSIHAIVAHVPCDEPSESWAKDVRWLHHLLTITSFVIRANRTWLLVVLLSSCRPPPNLFHCSRLVTREGDTWLYNMTANDMLTRVQPLGSCAMAQPISSEVSANQRVAYATVLHSSDHYVCGAIVLGHSIRRTGSSHEMVALVSKEIKEESRRGLREAGWTVKEIERIRNPNAVKGTYNEWNYSKLRLWQQTEYTKLLFIDSDLLLLTSVDFLFSYPEISARGNDGSDFNSGVMVLEPSDCTFELLMANLERVRSANGGDQGFLNNVFTWWHRLPESINTLKPVWTSDPVKKQAIIDMKSRWFSQDPSEIHAIHYLGMKPWWCYREFDCNVLIPDFLDFANEAAHKRWWSVHDSMPEPLKQFCWITSEAEEKLQKLIEQSKPKPAP